MAVSFNSAALLNGNGINVSSVVNAILAPKSGSISLLQNQQTDLSTQAGLLTGLNNNLTNLAAAVLSLASISGPLTAQSATSSQAGILTATAQTTAPVGTHQVIVSNLATIGTLYTDPLADSNASFLTGGATDDDLKLQVGTNGTGTIHDIAITAGNNDTFSTLASYINSQKWGVTANVVSDANGARLALTSQLTGTPGALAINSNNTGLTFNAPAGGTNASLTIDGVPFSSTSNTLTGAIAGVTLNLASAAPATQVQLTVGPDTVQATNAINSFVNAYNAVINGINAQFAVDPTTNSEGPLGGDSALRTLQSSLLQDATYSITGNGGLVNLASLGIDFNNDGTLTVNQVATDTHPSLSNVLATNPGAVQSFFQNASSTGFASNFNNDLFNLTDVTDGILNVDIAGNKTQQQALTTQINNLQDRLTAQRQQLTLQYAQVNATLEAFPSLLLQVTSEIGALNGNFSVNPSTVNTAPNTGTPTG
jgi:flagellar hook-associated protein 2